MKAYTDIPQSIKLAKILPIVSADMWYSHYGHPGYNSVIAHNGEQWFLCQIRNSLHNDIPCWSLAALLNILPYPSLHKTFSGWHCDSYNKEGTSCTLGELSDNPVDTCVNTIIELKEKNLL